MGYPCKCGIYTNGHENAQARSHLQWLLKDINTIWCGTDDGLIHVTRDGGKWKNVTRRGSFWSKVSLMEASHFDVNTAYAAVNHQA
jgi:hypothetical protein